MNPPHKVAVIGGGGMVGAATAYALMARNIPVEVVVNDVIEIAAEGQANDIADACALYQAKVHKGDLKAAGQCDLIIITAGYPQKEGESRQELLGKNKGIMRSICDGMAPLRKDAKILVVANPVDTLTHLVQKLSGLPCKQVFGSGTYLDSCRLRGHLSTMIDVHMNDIQAFVLGEHGDRQFVAWSSATIAGSPLVQHPKLKGQNLDAIREEVMRKAYEIIKAKRSTYFGIGMCTAVIAEACLNNQGKVFPLVNYNEKEKCYMSWPCTIGRDGVGQSFDIPLNDTERNTLKTAIEAIRGMCAEADAL